MSLKITFRGIAESPALETMVREEHAALTPLIDGSTRCEVVLEQPHRHHQTLRPFAVRLELHLPHQVLVAHGLSETEEAAGDAYAGVLAAFAKARQALTDSRGRARAARRHAV